MSRLGMQGGVLGGAVAPVALLALLVVSACAGPALEGRARAVNDLVATAKDSGAERCAPVELAMAESHVAFAEQELSEGDSHRAREELAIAEVNAREAVRKSPKDLCVPKKPKPRKPPTPKDRDGDGLVDKVDKCPADAEDVDDFEDEDGCPDLDNDTDGIRDVDDKCPLEPEDKDGFQDDDGCPDCDNDGDGVPECPQVVDMCPNKAAETPDGCPEYKNVVVTQKKIEIKQTVYFETNKARIKPVSFPLLNEVATVLSDNTEIEVRIEGHTDSRGGDEFNLRLSEARAGSVREFLMARGIAGERLQSQGFGETRPIASNRTRSGRAQNRRVEFVIVNR